MVNFRQIELRELNTFLKYFVEQFYVNEHVFILNHMFKIKIYTFKRKIRHLTGKLASIK